MMRVWVLLLLAGAAGAQEITFTAETTTGVETVTPVLSWSTSPVADSCVASGDWSGDKGAAGAETLAPITSSATYNLECAWAGSDTATLTWTPPSENTDGSQLTDLASYDIYYDAVSGGPYTNTVIVADPAATGFVVAGLATGNWCFVVTATNANGIESEVSNEACKVIADQQSVESVGITVNARPSAPSGLTVQ